jgi:hypothetical protein
MLTVILKGNIYHFLYCLELPFLHRCYCAKAVKIKEIKIKKGIVAHSQIAATGTS